MRNHFTALMLSAAVALAGGTLMAQTGGTGSAGNSMGGSSAQGTSDYNPGRPVSPANPNSTTGNTGTTNGNIPTPSSVSGSPSSIGSASLTSTSQTQIEGQLVDVLSASQRGGISGSSFASSARCFPFSQMTGKGSPQ